MDIWSVGCILGELLQMIPGNQSNPNKREILLRGRADWFLSPKNKESRRIQQEQISSIIEFFGTPSNKLVQRVQDQEFKKWLKSQEYVEPVDLKQRFSAADDSCLDLFRNMMRYEAENRFTADQCLNHSWLSDAAFDDSKMNLTHE